jgi:hypothetical protein
MSRNRKHPNIAYVMIPESVAPVDMTANILMDRDGRIGIELKASDGEYVVKSSSRGSKTRRINLPRSMVEAIPYGIHDVEFEQVGKLLVFDPKITDRGSGP